MEGFGVRLRPVGLDDADFIVWLRHQEHARGKLGDSARDAASQREWLRAYLQRPGDYYFIVETAGAAVSLGTLGIYDLAGSTAEMGRFIIRRGITAAVPGGVLLIDFAFGRLGLNELRATAVRGNAPVLSLTEKAGFRRLGVAQGARVIDGCAVDMVQMALGCRDWPVARRRIAASAGRAALRVSRWERAHQAARPSKDALQIAE